MLIKANLIMNIDRGLVFRIINKVFFLMIIIICFTTIVAVLTEDVGTKTLNEIGGAIGGITSPIVGILGALLIYLTFEQQNKAIKQPLILEEERVKNAKELILLDLKDNIRTNIKKLITDLTTNQSNLANINGHVVVENVNYIELNLDIYDSVGMRDIFLAFNKDTLVISSIYRRMEFIKNRGFGVLYDEYNININKIRQHKSNTEEYKELKIKADYAFNQNISSVINVGGEIMKDIDKITRKYK
ncbi:hypothetical protein GCM10027035_47750 [Emticicia sediminis]